MRSRVERLLRIGGLAAIAAWILNAAFPRAAGPVLVHVSELGDALPRWTREGAREAHVRIDTVPDAATSHWLAALRRAGMRITWAGDIPPSAMEVFRSAAPSGEVVVLASTTARSAVVADELGPIDTLRAAGAVSIRLAAVQQAVTLRAGAHRARALEPDREPTAESGEVRAGRREPGALFVAGAASWEAKFVIAALEEDGWRVDARLFVAPGAEVVQGSVRAPLDTATHAAVILIDSVAAETVRGVVAFVRAGGGAVLAGNASRARRVAPLLAWRARPREVAPLGTLPGDTLWRGLSRVPLALATSRSALALETRGSAATVVARRHYAGRVVAVGYDETWRWRMAGGANSVAEHRDWWTRIVGSVAARPSAARAPTSGAAPLAALHDVLGSPASPATPARSGFPRDIASGIFGLIAFAALVGEWLLRRARGLA